MHFADQALIVTNPEVSSVRDSDRVLGLLASKTAKAAAGETVKEHLVLTRYDPARVAKGEMLAVDDVQEILAIDLLAVIPESTDVLNASNSGSPVIALGEIPAAEAYKDMVARFLGEDKPHRFLEAAKKGLMGRLFGG